MRRDGLYYDRLRANSNARYESETFNRESEPKEFVAGTQSAQE